MTTLLEKEKEDRVGEVGWGVGRVGGKGEDQGCAQQVRVPIYYAAGNSHRRESHSNTNAKKRVLIFFPGYEGNRSNKGICVWERGGEGREGQGRAGGGAGQRWGRGVGQIYYRLCT